MNTKTEKQLAKLLSEAGNGARGITLWSGASLYDGTPIKVVLRFDGNGKTGKMHTVYILPDETHTGKTYNEARQQGLDTGNCGDCPLKGHYSADAGRTIDRICYVTGNGLHGLHGSIVRGNYPWLRKLAEQVGAGIQDTIDYLSPTTKPLRLGGWGDAAMVPWEVWHSIRAHERENCTNYTHQWRWLNIHYSGYCSEQEAYMRSISMASCHCPQDVRDATKLNWRKFITVPPLQDLVENYQARDLKHARQIVTAALRELQDKEHLAFGYEIEDKLARCPADHNLPNPITCERCPIGCRGRESRILGVWGSMEMAPNHTDVWIPAHGAPSIMAVYRRSQHYFQWMSLFSEIISREEAA